jgi:hypothetical protein
MRRRQYLLARTGAPALATRSVTPAEVWDLKIAGLETVIDNVRIHRFAPKRRPRVQGLFHEAVQADGRIPAAHALRPARRSDYPAANGAMADR